MRVLLNLFNKIPILVLLILSGIFVTMGDYFAKSWSQEQKTLALIGALIGYGGSTFFYIPTLLRAGLVYTAIIWDIISVFGFLFVGFVLFKETYTTMQLVGIALGVVSLILLSVGGK